MERANVKLRPTTRDRLRAAKIGGESYDETINRLLDQADETSRREGALAKGDP